MIRAGFLLPEDRTDMIALARDGSAAHRLARRANALVLLDDGWSCERVAKALFVDDDTVRTWHGLYAEDGFDGLGRFEAGGSLGRMSRLKQDELKAWITATLPHSTRQIGAFIEAHCGFSYEGRSGLIALLNRLEITYHKPQIIPRKLNEAAQKAFIDSYEKLLRGQGPDETVLFADAVHPTHAAKPTGCWGPVGDRLALEQTSGRQRINIHGAINLETGQTRMIEAETINAASTIRLLQSLQTQFPTQRRIHVFLDNARYHHARLVRQWLLGPECRITLHFIPPYCPHLNPIERLWGVMHKHVTHNQSYTTCTRFADATLGFLREKIPKNWTTFRDSITDNFRIIKPSDFRVMN